MPGFSELKKTSSRVCVSPAFSSICWGVLLTTWASSVAKSSRVETVEWDGTKDVLITWENVRDISLTIVKVDEQTAVPGW